MENKILSMHQPNFLPWIGLFHKIAKSDVFIILDTVQFPRGKTIANRNSIKTPNGAFELVVPISKPKGNNGKVSYREIGFGNSKWMDKILKTIEMSYKKAPYFREYNAYLQQLFTINNFAALNIKFIKDTASFLNISTDIKLLSDLKIPEWEDKNAFIANLARQNDCNIYLSGQGGKKYNNKEHLQQKGISLKYNTFAPFQYSQLHGEFIPFLSVIDLIFNMGKTERNFFL
jgi:hypothetical protein